jgi:hypothetical protein
MTLTHVTLKHIHVVATVKVVIVIVATKVVVTNSLTK